MKPNRTRPTNPLLLTLLALALLAAACGTETSADDATPSQQAQADDSGESLVIATTAIWADIVRNVACEGSAPNIQVETVIPEGGDPHAFEPSLANRARLEMASFVVTNGLGLEAGLVDTLEAVKQSGVPVIEMADSVAVLPLQVPTDFAGSFGFDEEDDEAGHDHEEEEEAHTHEHDPNTSDPHIWFDPQRVISTLTTIAESLVSYAGLPEDQALECLEQYRNELRQLDTSLEAQFNKIPAERRRIVTNHDALGYLAKRYGLEVIGTVSPSASTLAAANPAQLEELAKLIEADGVPVIFTETQRSDEDAQALASRAGAIRLVPLYTDTLGKPGSGADTYIGLLTTDAQRITDALSE